MLLSQTQHWLPNVCYCIRVKKETASVPTTSGTTPFPRVIQGHGQLAQSPLYDKLFVIIMHHVIHHAMENNSECRVSMEKGQKEEPEMKRINRSVLGKNVATQKQMQEQHVACIVEETIIGDRDIYQCFTDLNPLGLLIIEQLWAHVIKQPICSLYNY